jgi:hypothetical protein
MGAERQSGLDQFQPVANRRAGYGDALGMVLKVAQRGGTLAAGEGLLLIEYYEAELDRLKAMLRAANNTQEDA